MHRDLCPIHQVPMWWTPSDGMWACQVLTCQATMPKVTYNTGGPVTNPFWTDDRADMRHMFSMMSKAALLNTPPTGFLFRGTIT